MFAMFAKFAANQMGREMETIGRGDVTKRLTDADIREIVFAATDRIKPDGKKVLVIIPDQTRTCPLPQIVRELRSAIAPRAEKLDFLIALGTHVALDDKQIDKLLKIEPGKRADVLGDSKVFNHDWKNPDALAKIGTLTKDQISELTGGLFAIDIDVTINKMIFEYDTVMIAGPIFPHEVVGFSGGAKYFFPGICGQELLDFFHWLGAVITCPKIIGTKYTPVRATLHAALDMINVNTCLLAMVVTGKDLAGLYFGSVKDAWSTAVDLSDKLHIKYVDKPFDSILSRAPLMYDELWVGAKCMYKMESVIADGGELIIYAPHIEEISVVHGKIIEEIGYHSLPYFTNQWDKFKNYPWGVLAHSTHVRGIGTYENGVERPRVTVTLATGIPEEICRKVNLQYRDPTSIDISHWENHESESRLYVPKAGEMLYKLKNPPQWAS